MQLRAQEGRAVEMENFFSRMTLDIIGKAVFNYDFDSLTHDDPVIKVGCCARTASSLDVACISGNSCVALSVAAAV